MAKLSRDDWHFILRRLHSLTGIIPIGGFLLFHFFENASARHGAAAFDQTVTKIAEMPYLFALEIGVLGLPILFHAIYGLFITSSSRPNVGGYGYARNWAYFFQRLTGLIAFAYIFFHVATTRIYALMYKGTPITFADMHSMLSQPWIFAFYIVGILAVTYHFSNGLWSFSITWGLVRSHIGQQRLAALTIVIFLLLSIVGVDIVSAFMWDQGLLARLGSSLRGV